MSAAAERPSGLGRLLALVPREARRFVLVGLLVAGIYYALMALFSVAIGIPNQPSLALAYVLAVCVHFVLNRQYVFTSTDGYHHRLSAQGIRYLVVGGIAYGITALCMAFLPDALGLAPIVVYFIVAPILPIFSFVALRLWVFVPANRRRHGA